MVYLDSWCMSVGRCMVTLKYFAVSGMIVNLWSVNKCVSGHHGQLCDSKTSQDMCTQVGIIYYGTLVFCFEGRHHSPYLSGHYFVFTKGI